MTIGDTKPVVEQGLLSRALALGIRTLAPGGWNTLTFEMAMQPGMDRPPGIDVSVQVTTGTATSGLTLNVVGDFEAWTCRPGAEMNPSDSAGFVDSPETVTEAVRILRGRGFDDEFTIRPDGVRCPTCGRVHPTTSIEITDVYRFEGESDPGDEAIVLGARCSSCGSRGIVVSAYGPDADDQLRALADEHGRRRH